MKNYKNILSIILSTLFLIPLLAKSGPQDGAFLRTAQILDEPRGYCLDIAGFGETIRIEAALRFHTCKYKELNTDQYFGLGSSDQQIYVPAYDICLHATSISEGSELFTQPCSSIDNQIWDIFPNGFISPASNHNLCITAGAESRNVGTSGGDWLIDNYRARSATLEICENNSDFQELRWGYDAEQERSFTNTIRLGVPDDIQDLINEGPPMNRPLNDVLQGLERTYTPDELEITENIAYGPKERNLLNVYRDLYRTNREPVPVVIYFHGGGFARGGFETAPNVPAYFASLGMVGVNATYSLIPEARWPDGAVDVGAAVSWVRENISEYGGDPEQIYVIGSSAGAHNVATYVFRPDVLPAGTPEVAGAILISGVYSSPSAWEDGLDTNLYFSDANLDEVSIINNIKRTSIPTLIAVADNDLPHAMKDFTSIIYDLHINHGYMPSLILVQGHNHTSYTRTIGTADKYMSAEILDFILNNRN